MIKKLIVVEGKHDLLLVKTLCHYECGIKSDFFYTGDYNILINIYDKKPKSATKDVVRNLKRHESGIKILYADTGRKNIINSLVMQWYKEFASNVNFLFIFDEDPDSPTKEMINNNIPDLAIRKWLLENSFFIIPSVEDLISIGDKKFQEYFKAEPKKFYDFLKQENKLDEFQDLIHRLRKFMFSMESS